MTTRNTQHYDVIIAGARCAGAATALLLARQGARVLVLDKSRYGTDTLSTHALMRGAVLQLQRWGLLPAVVEAGTPPVRSTTFHLADGDTTIRIKPKHGVEALYAPRRRVLDAILADAARNAGADVRFGASVSDLRRNRAGRVTGITGRVGGARLEASADLVIGADGRRSTVAWCVGARAAHVAPASSVLIYRYVRDDAPDDYHWYFRDGAAAGVIPTNDGQACVFAATSAERLRGEPDQATHAAWRRILAQAAPGLAERLDQRGPAGPPRVFPGLTGYLREAAGPGWALVGDAGYFKDPITAHGITDALRDAEILARAVAAGGPDAVGRYQAERDELSLRLFRVTGRMASFAWTADEIAEDLLELGEAMAEEAAAMTVAGPGRRLELASA
jgi:menaquinone-9 beta-reductase